jgi:hypothetical protein
MVGAAHDHSRWGTADQIGAANLLTPQKRLAAPHSVRDGRIYDVSHEIGADAPFMSPNQTPFLLSIWASSRDSIKRRRRLGATNDAGSNVERMEMTAHVGTHIALEGMVRCPTRCLGRDLAHRQRRRKFIDRAARHHRVGKACGTGSTPRFRALGRWRLHDGVARIRDAGSGR